MYRDLGILGHLPAFGGWAPWALAVKQNDTSVETGGPNHATRGVCPEKDCDTVRLDAARLSLHPNIAYLSRVGGLP